MADVELEWPAKFRDLAGLVHCLPASDIPELIGFLRKKFNVRDLVEYMVGFVRYQPKKLIPIFGYDHLYLPAIEFELAGIDTLAEIGVIPASDHALLTPAMREDAKSIATTLVDELERTGGGHDIIALTEMMKPKLPKSLRRWVHYPFTSYDPLGTSLALQLLRAYQKVIRPQLREVIKLFAAKVYEHADTKQMGHTHLQPALPVTAGFWLATILWRLIDCARKLDVAASGLVGKASGATGSRNSQVLLKINERCGKKPFDERVLEKLGLKPARITTQIPPPEPVIDFLYCCMKLAQVFGQLGNDCRILMMREIGEVEESASGASTASSAMSGKIANPRWSEANVGMAGLAKWAFQLPLDFFNSDLQRDLRNSGPFRFFPLTVVFLCVQLENLLKPNKETNDPFLGGIVIHKDACLANLRRFGAASMGEAVHLTLYYFGYEGDAHKLVNKKAAPASRKSGRPIVDVVLDMAKTDEALREVIRRIPEAMLAALRDHGFGGVAGPMQYRIPPETP